MRKQGFNPYLPSWEYIPDGEPYVFGDRVYVYGSHDRFNGCVFCMGDYVTWSAPVNDLTDWRYEGVIYPKDEDPANKDGSMCLYAPDMTVGPDGRYYLYYVLDHLDIVSVAVCDSPCGRFSFYGYVHYPDGTYLGRHPGDEPQFDPGVLTEGNTTYLYTGFCGDGDRSRHGAMVTVLEPDMLTIRQAPRFVAPGKCYEEGTSFEGHAFFEAPSIRKNGDTYYFVYSSSVMHELCYATSKSPVEGFRYGGVIVSNCDLHVGEEPLLSKAFGGNNHGSIIQIGEQWYIFYHRQTNGHWYSRQGCAEPIRLLDDGSIPQVEMTSCGLNGGPLVGKGTYPAYICCHLYTTEMQKHPGEAVYASSMDDPKVTQDGQNDDREQAYVANIKNGTVIGYRSFDFCGVKRITLQIRAYADGGKMEVRTSANGPALAVLPLRNTNVWTDYTANFMPPDGVSDLYLAYSGTGNAQLNSITFD